MRTKILLVLALATLLPIGASAAGNAADPPPTPPADAVPGPEPDDPNAAPYPPDGVIDPNAEYPTDGAEGTDQGEAGAPADPPPAAGDAAPKD
jgi:hypothetical protein